MTPMLPPEVKTPLTPALSPRGEGAITATVFQSAEVSSRVPSPLGEKDRMRGSAA
jgi:hypothetical protein